MTATTMTITASMKKTTMMTTTRMNGMNNPTTSHYGVALLSFTHELSIFLVLCLLLSVLFVVGITPLGYCMSQSMAELFLFLVVLVCRRAVAASESKVPNYPTTPLFQSPPTNTVCSGVRPCCSQHQTSQLSHVCCWPFATVPCSRLVDGCTRAEGKVLP